MTIVEQETSTFRAAAITAARTVGLVDIAKPVAGPGEAVVRIEATAICTWEQRTYSGVQDNRFPFIGGHEIAGTIESIGEGYSGQLREGDRVAIGAASCGTCYWCHTGQDQQCAQHYAGSVDYAEGWGPGGFAEYKVHPVNGLYSIGDVPAHVAALTEPLSCALHAARLSGAHVGLDVVVIGAGVMGLMNVLAMKQYGARVIVSEVDPGRLEKARAHGADVLIDATTTDPVAAVKELTDGRGAAVVVAAIGHKSANEQGLQMISNRGSFVVFASAHPENPIEVGPNALHNREQRLIGVVSSDSQDFALAARLLRNRQLDLSGLIQNTYPLSKIEDALEEAILPGTYRIVIDTTA